MTDFVLAVDGGGVKTDLALVHTDGRLMSLVRGGGSSPHYVGVEGCVALLEELLAQALVAAGSNTAPPPPAAAAQIMLAGADLDEEVSVLCSAIEPLGWSEQLVVGNDTLALLRSGTDRGWGVAVVCGGGINCVGLAPDGRQLRFPSLGAISGDWGGGGDIGLAALTAAARGADGRGPRTVLETEVPTYFGLAEPFDLSRALHLGELQNGRLGELVRVVFAVCEADPVAAAIATRLADEVIAFATAAMRRLGLQELDVDVVLGGGVMRAAPAGVLEAIVAGVRRVAPEANVRVATSPPIVGAALLAFDVVGANAKAAHRATAELGGAFRQIEGDGARVSDGRTIVLAPGGDSVGAAHG